jgi:hypothetical protein
VTRTCQTVARPALGPTWLGATRNFNELEFKFNLNPRGGPLRGSRRPARPPGGDPRFPALTYSEWGPGAMAVSRRPIPAPGGIRPVGRRDRPGSGESRGPPRSLLGALFPGGARAMHADRPGAGVVQLKLD